MTAVTYRRIQHAAHYAYGDPRKGHDLEEWDVPDAEVTRHRGDPIAPDSVPRDAHYHHGYLLDGAQRWVFRRTAPMTGTCQACAIA